MRLTELPIPVLDSRVKEVDFFLKFRDFLIQGSNSFPTLNHLMLQCGKSPNKFRNLLVQLYNLAIAVRNFLIELPNILIQLGERPVAFVDSRVKPGNLRIAIANLLPHRSKLAIAVGNTCFQSFDPLGHEHHESCIFSKDIACFKLDCFWVRRGQ